MKNKAFSINQDIEPIRFIRIRDVMGLTGISKSHIYHLSATSDFPKRVSLVPGGSAVGWVESEILGWVDQRIKARDMEV